LTPHGVNRVQKRLTLLESHFTAIHELAQQSRGGVNLLALLDKAVIAVRQAVGVEYCGVQELLADGRSLLLRAGAGWKVGYVGQATMSAKNHSVASFTLLSPQPVIVKNLAKETRFSRSTLLREHGAVSGLSVAIAGRDRPFGVLSAYTASERRFSSEEIRFLQAFSSVLALAIERKRAEESLRQLSGRLLRLQDEERRRLARELHDTTSQALAALVLNLGAVRKLAGKLSPVARKALSESLALAKRSSRETRTLSYLLHPPMLDEFGLALALRGLVEGFEKRSGILVDLDVPSDVGRLPQEVATVLFRLVQECLMNVHYHSSSKRAKVQLLPGSHEITLEVKDQGLGILSKAKRAIERGVGAGLGVGIQGMQERVRLLGGQLKIHSSRRGTTVTAILPVSRDTS
jgi:signal transduction histidine kinase